MSIILILLLISLPIFYFYGFICFLRNIFGSQKPEGNTEGLLVEIVNDLNELKNKNTTILSLLTKYKKKLGLAPGETSLPAAPAPPNSSAETSQVSASTPQNVLTQDVNQWWERWYEENNINLLLYIGAFLIVSSAAIFVGFNWETLTGSLKAVVLGFMTLAFFGSGFYFYLNPKLKNAGSTFLAIGSLLIPFNGLAWYNFVLKDQGITFGFVWMVTSLVAVLTYFGLSLFIKNTFYTYIAGLGGLSLVEALVNVSALDSQFYILGGIFSAFALLSGSLLVSQIKKEDFEKIFGVPLRVSAHVIMPIFLSWGLLVAYSTDRLFTMEATVSTLIAAAYYFLAYITSNSVTFFVLGELILMLGVVLLAKTNGIKGVSVFYIIDICTFLFQVGSLLFKEFKKNLESYYSNVIAVYAALLGLGISFVDPLVSASERTYLVIIMGLLAGFAYFISKRENFLFLSVGAIDLSAFLWVVTVMQRNDWYNNLGIFYLAFAVGLYFLGQNLWKNKKNLSSVFLISSVANFVFAFLSTATSPSYSLAVSLTLTGVVVIASYYFEQSDLAYAASVFAAFSTFNILRLFASPVEYYPLAFAALGYLIYFLHLSPLPSSYRTVFKNSSIVVSVLNPLLFGIYSLGTIGDVDAHLLEMNSLISAYATTGLLTFEAVNFKDSTIGYTASATALATILWQYKYLHVTEFQVYAITAALYFLGLAYLKRGQGKTEEQNTFDLIGLGILLVPLSLQAFPEAAFGHALLLGVEGVILLIIGFNLSHRTYIYAGAAAIAVATLTRIISFITSIPSWVTIGLGGLIFLAVAIYLLSQRKEKL